MSDTALWLTLAGLGAYHGINPAMGWLFAVSRGLQQGSRRAVIGSLLPIAIGHELSLVLVAIVVFLLAEVVAPTALHVGAAAVLIGFGIFRFAKPRAHWRWTTMRVTNRELTLWSFLMSTAHGAGLMVAPVLIGLGGADAAGASSRSASDVAMVSDTGVLAGAAGLALHVGAMLLVMGVVAVAIYEKVGLRVLGKAWVNTDQVWAIAFVWAGIATLLS